MKKLKYILIFILSVGLLNSCLIDDETPHDDYDQGPNLAGFLNSTTGIMEVADGTEYTEEIEMVLQGPTSNEITNDITVTLAVDPSSTAIEGTHYRLDNTTITLKASNDHLALFEFTMLTDGVIAPLAKSPVLVLEIVSATGDPNVIANGKKITITLNYGCPSNLAGIYDALVIGNGETATFVETITEYGYGKYGTTRVGTWSEFSSGFGLEFEDVCNTITVPLHDLGHMYSNEIWGHKEGSVDPVTGVITLYYTISGGWGEYTAVYTPISK